MLDSSFGRDPSVGHLQIFAPRWLNRYQIKYILSSTTKYVSTMFLLKTCMGLTTCDCPTEGSRPNEVSSTVLVQRGTQALTQDAGYVDPIRSSGPFDQGV